MYQSNHDNASIVNSSSMPPNASDQNNNSPLPYVQIIEQPASKSVKFRYKSEPSRGGLIFGAKNPLDKSSFPKIRVVGYNGPAWVRATCVTIDEPYRAHPHNLVGKKYCSAGICQMPISQSEMIAEFPNLGIQCVKRNDAERELKRRKENNVDPFKVGFEHSDNISSINFNAVRLCFEVFILTADMKTWMSLEPVVSDPIYDKKAMSDLVITRLSHSSASAKGGQEMILLCEKVIRDDVVIRFFEEKSNWEDFGIFEPKDVHKQVAILFKTPPYYNSKITKKVKVNIQLRRKLDVNITSESKPFFFVPDESVVHKSKGQHPLSEAVNTNNNDSQQSGSVENLHFSNGQQSGVNNGLPRKLLRSHSPSARLPGNDKCIPGVSSTSNSQLHTPINQLDHERVQLPPISSVLQRFKQPRNFNGAEQNFICDSPHLPDENMMSMTDCDRLTVTNHSHYGSENNVVLPSTCLERLSEMQPHHDNVFDVSPLMLHADPLFTGHHPFRSMDYTSTMESGYINTGNGMSLEDIVNFEDLISNNMSALSENLSSSLSMST